MSALIPLFFFFFFSSSIAQSQATVPPSKTFKYVNQGEFSEYTGEYGAYYRTTGIFNRPFALYFYNTTPNAFTLGLRMGSNPSESIMRWVWEANRDNPVRDNATLTFGRDGNLVLADADGRVAWQTGTANKGVVGLQLLPNGNMVLVDHRGRFVWQSFNYPTDTLLVGQGLLSSGATKLVSRVSEVDGSEGPYSLFMEPERLAMYFKSKQSLKPSLYFTFSEWFSFKGSLAHVTFNSAPETDDAFAYKLTLEQVVANSSTGATHLLARPKYNSTFSFLRLDFDGNLRVYTYYDKVDWGRWEVTYTLFSRDWTESECQLPEKCGELGLCEDNQCVACPMPNGLMGWSKNCAPLKPPPCNGGTNVGYYKILGVDHFSSKYVEGDGPMKLVECREKCSKDCKCMGFFYREDTSKCLLTPQLNTLTKVSNSSHLAFIKVAK